MLKAATSLENWTAAVQKIGIFKTQVFLLPMVSAPCPKWMDLALILSIEKCHWILPSPSKRAWDDHGAPMRVLPPPWHSLSLR